MIHDGSDVRVDEYAGSVHRIAGAYAASAVNAMRN